MRTLNTQEIRATAGGTLCLPSLFSLLLCAKVALPTRHTCTKPVRSTCGTPAPKPECPTTPDTDDTPTTPTDPVLEIN